MSGLRIMSVLGAALLALAACEEVPATGSGPEATVPATTAAAQPSRAASRNFLEVVRKMEPVTERECRARTSNVNCDFRIVVDDRPDQAPNAFQTLDRNGRPIIAFTISLIAEAKNEDELAFILGHEAAHHIEGHLKRQRQNAITSAVILSGLATLTGADAGAVRSAQELGFEIGARTYSKEFELEADALGTILTAKAGYDPVRGAAFFNRIPDPGDKFLGTHPPNAKRIETVRKTAANL